MQGESDLLADLYQQLSREMLFLFFFKEESPVSLVVPVLSLGVGSGLLTAHGARGSTQRRHLLRELSPPSWEAEWKEGEGDFFLREHPFKYLF